MSTNGNRRAGKGAAAHSVGVSDITASENSRDTRIAQAIQPCWADVQGFTGEQYDEHFEDGLTTAIHDLITFASTCRDRPDAVIIRPSETIAALANAMAKYITMDPTASPYQIRKGVDRVAKHLRVVALDMARNAETENVVLPRTQGAGWLS
jgi:hypothetical protein